MHSIKGAGGAVGLNDLSNFAHKVEDVLSILRNQPQFVNSAMVSSLLKVVDALKSRITQLRTGDRSTCEINFLEKEMVDIA